MTLIGQVVLCIAVVEAILVIPLFYHYLNIVINYAPVDVIGFYFLANFGPVLTLLFGFLLSILSILPVVIIGIMASTIAAATLKSDAVALIQWCFMEVVLIAAVVYCDDLRDPPLLSDPRALYLLTFKTCSIPFVLLRILQILSER